MDSARAERNSAGAERNSAGAERRPFAGIAGRRALELAARVLAWSARLARPAWMPSAVRAPLGHRAVAEILGARWLPMGLVWPPAPGHDAAADARWPAGLSLDTVAAEPPRRDRATRAGTPGTAARTTAPATPPIAGLTSLTAPARPDGPRVVARAVRGSTPRSERSDADSMTLPAARTDLTLRSAPGGIDVTGRRLDRARRGLDAGNARAEALDGAAPAADRGRARDAGAPPSSADAPPSGKDLALTASLSFPHRLAHGPFRWLTEAVRHARVHTGVSGDRRARAAGARAMTVGRDIFFRAGRFEPETPRGLALISHELAHVWQHARGGDLHARHAPHLEHEAASVERTVFRAAAAGALPRAPLSGSGPVPGAAPVSLHFAASLAATATSSAVAPPSVAAAPAAGRASAVTLRAPEESAGPSPEPASTDPAELTAHVFKLLERRLRIDRERAGMAARP